MGTMNVWYDQDGDYLAARFDEAPASMEEVAADLFERRTPEGRIVGFAVFNFSKQISANTIAGG